MSSDVRLEHSLLDFGRYDMISTGGIPGGVYWKAINTTLISEAVITLMGADYFLPRLSLISYLVISGILNIWLGYTPPMIALNSVEILITCENLVASMARERAYLFPLNCFHLIASIILAVICWTSHCNIQDTISWILRTFTQSIYGDPTRFPATPSYDLGFRAWT